MGGGPFSPAPSTLIMGESLKKQRIVRTAEVTIETEESVSLQTRLERTSLLWCAACDCQVEMATPERAARIAGLSPRVIYAGVESGKVHFSELPRGLLLVCLDSLIRATALGH